MNSKISFYSIAGITLFMIVMFFFQEQRVTSDFEARSMTIFPTFSVSAFVSGDFQTDFEEALKDQVFERDSIMSFTTTITARNREYYNFVNNQFAKLKTFATSQLEQSPVETSEEERTVDDENGGNEESTNNDSSNPLFEQGSEADNETEQEGEVSENNVSPSDDNNDAAMNEDEDINDEQIAKEEETNTSPDRDSETVAGGEQPENHGDEDREPTNSQQQPGSSNHNEDAENDTRNDLSEKPAEPAPAPGQNLVNEYALQPVGTIYKISGTDYLVEYPTLNNSASRRALDMKAYQFEEMLERHPDLKLYAYYVTKAQDLDWFDKSENIQSFDYIDYLSEQLSSNVAFDYLKFSNMEDYQRLAYKTDHHWSHEGSYQGYKDMYQLMARDFSLSPMKEPARELDFDGLDFFGSLVGSAGGENNVSPDAFKAYEFDLGSYRSFLNEEEQEFHQYEEYANGEYGREDRHFMNYHGNLEGSNIVRHEFSDHQYNLLMIADSNNRPIRRLLASHFATTYFVEYRMLASSDLDKIIEEYEIDAVLIYGQDRYWTDQRYLFKDYPIP